MDDAGYLGYWHRGSYILGMHADWPAYPGPGSGDALYDMCQFPHGTTFSPVDDIDQCVLFVTSGAMPKQPMRGRTANFHIAAWHSDLVGLANDGLVQGIVSEPEIEWRSQDGQMGLGWIWTDNLRPLLTEIGLLVGYRLDDPDWIAVECGVLGTDSEAGRWFDYPIGRILVSVALEPGADEVASVRTGPATEAELEKIRWLTCLMQNWHLSDASGA